ncbi:hypothetical protein V494_05188 [Pseudogymnoascus sp. VKM F-4513 (FW-928)]|nr:hypothetical protein V494_05188 [Pseudogymnoascus sp. VKM F-4513 (FW-928)]
MGKSPALCSPDSAFITTYHACTECIGANRSDSSQYTPLPEFAQYISYCDLALATSTGIFTLTDGKVATIFYVVPATASASPTGSSSSSTKPTSTGPTATTAPAPVSSSTTPPTTPPHSSTTSKAWIAGPVLGAIAVVALILGLLFYMRRRGRKTNITRDEFGSPYEKAELHADDVKKPVYEAATHDIHEIEGSSHYLAQKLVEKPANETPAIELETVEAKEKRNPEDNEPK